MLTLSLPVPPTSNNAFANRQSGKGYGRVKSSGYRSWIREADRHYMLQSLGRRKGIVGPYSVKLTFPDKKRGDLDGRQKLVIDWLVSRNLVQGDDPKFLRKLESIFSLDQPQGLVSIMVRSTGDAA